MGSTSDWEVMSAAVDMLAALDIPYEKRVVSAHRTPQLMYEYAATARERGIDVIIAGAGGAAHLPGMVAAMTSLPVIGVPVKVACAQRTGLASVDRTDARGRAGGDGGDQRSQERCPYRRLDTSLQDKALSERLDAFRRKADSRRTRSPIAVAMTKTIGIIGGGQLGMMIAQAAAQMGVGCICLDPSEDAPRGLGMQAPYSRGIRRYGRTRRAVPRERCRNIRI